MTKDITKKNITTAVNEEASKSQPSKQDAEKVLRDEAMASLTDDQRKMIEARNKEMVLMNAQLKYIATVNALRIEENRIHNIKLDYAMRLAELINVKADTIVKLAPVVEASTNGELAAEYEHLIDDLASELKELRVSRQEAEESLARKENGQA